MYDLGNKLKHYGTSWGEVFRYFAFSGLAVALFISVSRLDTSYREWAANLPPVALLLAGWLLVYLVVMLIITRNRPQITVYERGVQVTHKGETKEWLWKQLTRLDGTRHYQRINLIPVMAWGANTVYAGDEAAFKISVLTARSSELADLVGLKMVEQRLPDYIQQMKDGQQWNFGNLNVSRDGLQTKKEMIPWSDVQQIEMKDWFQPGHAMRFKVQRNSQNRAQEIAKLEGSAGYALSGILDHFRFGDTFARLQDRVLRGGWLPRGAGGKLSAFFNVLMVMGIGVISVGADMPALERFVISQTGGAQYRALLGENNTVCRDPDRNNRARLASDVVYAVVDADGHYIRTDLQSAIPEAQRAVEGGEAPVVVLCVREDFVRVERCPYEGSDFERFDIERYRADYEISIVVVDSGDEMDRDNIRGETPSNCPDEASRDHGDIYGDVPTVEAFVEWFKDFAPNR
jgi:hypothetical protein